MIYFNTRGILLMKSINKNNKEIIIEIQKDLMLFQINYNWS